MEPVEKLATTPCRSTLAAWAKGMALDGVRGKTATMRLAFSLWDDLDVMEGNLEPRRRAPKAMMPERDDLEDTETGTGSLGMGISQGIIDEPPSPMWGEYTGESPGFASSTSPPDLSRPATAGRPDETGPECESEKKSLLDGEPESASSWVARSRAGHDMEGSGGGAMQFQTAASPLSEGDKQGLKTESERSFLAEAARNARKVPSEKELRRREEQGEAERLKRVYESLPGKIKAFCDKHGYEYPANMELPKVAPSPHSDGQAQDIINPRPAEGPYTRALRERLLKLAAAERAEAERKAALAAKAVPLTPTLSPRSGGEGDVSPPPREIDMRDPEPLPDYAIWMHGQRAAP